MVDQAIGRVLDYLEETHKLDNTLIIFTSDHGEMLQDKGYYSKELPYESSVRVPFIIKYPQNMVRLFSDQKECREFIDSLDIFPTCLDICGLMYPENNWELAGLSLCSEEFKKREIQICSTSDKPSDRWIMAKNHNYKYIYNYNGGYEELYDLQADPRELTNLLGNTDHNFTEIADSLRQAALAWETKWGPAWCVDNGNFVVAPKVENHASRCGKFHLWSNMQMQKFDRRSGRKRAETFLNEIRYALSDKEYSGVELPDVFNDPQWKENFCSWWKGYTGLDFYWDEMFSAGKDSADA